MCMKLGVIVQAKKLGMNSNDFSLRITTCDSTVFGDGAFERMALSSSNVI